MRFCFLSVLHQRFLSTVLVKSISLHRLIGYAFGIAHVVGIAHAMLLVPQLSYT